MDHAEARELLELAAAEPGGLERLDAGDTPEAAAVAGHLVDCPSCAAELMRLRRVAALLTVGLAPGPSPELRERMLALVREAGRPRVSVRATATTTEPAAEVAASSEPPARAGVPAGPPRSRPWQRQPAWVIAVAAALVVAVGLGGGALGWLARGGSTDDAATALTRVTTQAARLLAGADTASIALIGPGAARGSLIVSPGSRELVVLAAGLPVPPAGREYRCYVEVDGVRRLIGRMRQSGELAFWGGALSGAWKPGSSVAYGVVIGTTGSDEVDGQPVLEGALQSAADWLAGEDDLRRG